MCFIKCIGFLILHLEPGEPFVCALYVQGHTRLKAHKKPKNTNLF